MGPLPQGILRGKENGVRREGAFYEIHSRTHTIGPRAEQFFTPWAGLAAALFRSEHPEADHFRVVLYGSLALTGRGHLTDQAVREALDPVDAEIVFLTAGPVICPTPQYFMDLFACRDGRADRLFALCWSTGGGAITLVAA